MLETFTLSDDIDLPKERREFSGHKVTDIRAAVHTKRVNIFINDKFFCSLDISQVVDLKIKVGRELSEEELSSLKRASEFSKFYSLALEYVFLRPHSRKEINDYLVRKTLDRKVRVKNRKTGEYQTKIKQGYDKSLVPLVLQRLDDHGYLDDERFAKLWVENRNVSKGVSQKKLQSELLQKGIATHIIDKVLSNTSRSDEDELKKVVAKKRNRYTDEQKFIQYLLRQGFNYSDILDELSSTESSEWA